MNNSEFDDGWESSDHRQTEDESGWGDPPLEVNDGPYWPNPQDPAENDNSQGPTETGGQSSHVKKAPPKNMQGEEKNDWDTKRVEKGRGRNPEKDRVDDKSPQAENGKKSSQKGGWGRKKDWSEDSTPEPRGSRGRGRGGSSFSRNERGNPKRDSRGESDFRGHSHRSSFSRGDGIRHPDHREKINDESTGDSVMNRVGSLNESIHAIKTDPPYVNKDRVLSGGKAHQRVCEEELSKRMERIRIQNEKLLEKHKIVEEDEKAFRQEEEERKKKELDNLEIQRKKKEDEEEDRRRHEHQQKQLQEQLDNEREENAKRKIQNRDTREWDKEKEESNNRNQRQNQRTNFGPRHNETERKNSRGEESNYDRRNSRQENNEYEEDYNYKRNSRDNERMNSPRGGGEYGGGYAPRGNRGKNNDDGYAPRNSRGDNESSYRQARARGGRGRGGGGGGGGRRNGGNQNRDSYKATNDDWKNDKREYETSDKPAPWEPNEEAHSRDETKNPTNSDKNDGWGEPDATASGPRRQ